LLLQGFFFFVLHFVLHIIRDLQHAAVAVKEQVKLNLRIV